ncbi:MAG TPA: SGNH/GDSL hydrolase family protein [Flavisolibacter sp.]|jgi:lysophospholipase L1-like esterase|nr:SGNH/GDSL hydrolase family protein [Flavisolibacter sp.]
MHIYNYLALGDSYTIGEAVPLMKSFPCQVVQLLRSKEYNFNAPEIIAKTGWTTDELLDAISKTTLLSKYDFVTLLIGVNNQYRGRDALEYKEQFEELLKKAIELANGKKEHVMVVSIPDYSVTPYANSMDTEKTSKEVEVFNGINKALSIQYKVQYVDITELSRQAKSNAALVATDGLHPSEKEYAKWAEKIVEAISSQLK